MKSWAWILAALITAPASAWAGVPKPVRELYKQLLPLGEGKDGFCTARAAVWQQQIARLPQDGLEPVNVVVYFAPLTSKVGPRWYFHIAPAVRHEGALWVLEKSPYVRRVLSLDAWIAKLLGTRHNPCVAFTAAGPGSIPSGRETCASTVLKAAETNPWVVLEGGKSWRQLDLTKYQKFSEQCAVVLEGGRSRCHELFPESTFDSALFNNDVFSEAMREESDD